MKRDPDMESLTKDELMELVAEILSRHPEAAWTVEKWLQRQALEQVAKRGFGKSGKGGDDKRNTKLVEQVCSTFLGQMEHLVDRWSEEAVSLDLQCHWDETVCELLSEILEEIDDAFDVVENLREQGEAFATARCCVGFLDLAIRAQDETSREPSYGAHDELSLDEAIDRAEAELDELVTDGLTGAEVTEILVRLRELCTIPGSTNWSLGAMLIDHLEDKEEASAHFLSLAEKSYREYRRETTARDDWISRPESRNQADYRRYLKILLYLDVGSQRFEAALMLLGHFGNDYELWDHLVSLLEGTAQWEALAEAIRKMIELKADGYTGYLKDRLCKALLALGQESEVLKIRWTAFRERPERRLFDDILRLVPNRTLARAEMIAVLEADREHHVQCLGDLYIEDKRWDDLADLFRTYPMMLTGSTDHYTKALARTRYWRLAVDAWIQVAESEVRRYTREGYRRAAGLLARAKSTAARRGEKTLVTKMVADLRQRYPKRHALLEELERAGLLK